MEQEEKKIDLEDIARRARDDWFAANSEKTIEAKVNQILEARIGEIIAKLLGFDNRWGDKWEVDHCNGRKGESAAGDWLRGKVGTAVDKYFEEYIQLPVKLPKGVIDSLRKDYLETFSSEMQTKLCEFARQKASAAAEEIASSIAEEGGADDTCND